MKVRSDILRLYQSLHTWTGILTSMVLFIGFFAGGITVFKPAIDKWITPPSMYDASYNVAQLQKLTQLVLTNHAEAKRQLIVDINQEAAAPVSWYKSDRKSQSFLTQTKWQANLNADGVLLSEQVTPSALAKLIDLLHQTAGIPGKLGRDYLGGYLLGVAAILYFLALVSGVIVLLPTLVKSLFAVRLNKGVHRKWLDVHNIVGLGSLPFHLIISLTVIVFVFHDPIYGSIQHVVYGEKPIFPRNGEPANIDYASQELQPLTKLVSNIESQATGYKVTRLTFSNLDNHKASVRADILDSSQMMRGPITDYMFLNPYTGELVRSTITAGEKGIWTRVVASFFALHFGSYGGEWGRWLYLLFGFMGAAVFYTGNLLWLEKRRKNMRQANEQVTQARSVTLLASATVGVCLGSMLALACSMLGTKWLLLSVENVNYVTLYCYYIVFVGAVSFAFIVGAARAAFYLLKLTSVVLMLFPLTSIGAWFVPNNLVWFSQDSASIIIDFVALVFAFIAIYFTFLVKKRALNAEQDSLWRFTPYRRLKYSTQASQV